MPSQPPDGYNDQPASPTVVPSGGPPDGYNIATVASPPDGYETRSFPSRVGSALGKGINAVLDPVAEAVKPSLQQIASRPEMQPFKSATDPLESVFPKPTGSAVEDVEKSMAGVAEAPLRLANTLQIPQMITQQKTQDYLVSKGANKYVALAAGMLAGAVADPINAAAAYEIGSGINRYVKSRNALKSEIISSELKSAINTAKTMGVDDSSKLQDWLQKTSMLNRDAPDPEPMFPDTGYVNQSQLRSAQIEARQRELDARQIPSGTVEPTKFSELSVPSGEPSTELKKLTPDIPQYIPEMGAKTGESRMITDSLGHHLEQPRLIEMRGRGQIGTKLGEVETPGGENRILVPEGTEPTRPGTREVPPVHQGPPEIVAPGGVYGEPIPNPSIPTEHFVDESTNHMELPISTEFQTQEPPKGIRQWSDSAIKELHDLNSSSELASPTVDPHNDFRSTVRRFFGHIELGRFDSTKLTDEFAGFVQDKSRRMLITLYSQLGRAPTIEELNTLRTTLGKVKSSGVKSIGKMAEDLMDQSLSLTPTEQRALGEYNRYFEGVGQAAQKIGIIPRLKEIYGGPHVYEPKADAEAGFIRRIVTGKSKFSQPRIFNSVVEAVQSGWVPKTLDSAELLSIYHNNISRASAERYLMDTLEKQGLINYEGRGNQIKSFQREGLKIGKVVSKITGKEEGEVYKKIPYSDNPEVQKVMSRIAEDPVLDYPIIHAIEKLNGIQKMGSLYLQVFHPKALAMEALGKGFSPAKFQEGLKLIDENPEYVRSMIRSGLDVNVVADIGKELSSSATKEYRGSNPVSWTRKINSIYTDWVFSKYMTGLKVWNTNVVAKRLIDMGLTTERSLELAVEDSNRTFGGLNLGLLNRSPNMQRLFHMLAFAPDWTESRLRQMAAPFGRGLGDVTSKESQLVAQEAKRYWTRTMALATVTHIAGAINPYEKFLKVDMSAESGFKDVTKLAKLLQLDPIYFSSKMAAAPRTLVDFMDPRLSVNRKLKHVFMEPLPLPIQSGIREYEKMESQ